jgi:hypothetical protein
MAGATPANPSSALAPYPGTAAALSQVMKEPCSYNGCIAVALLALLAVLATTVLY